MAIRNSTLIPPIASRSVTVKSDPTRIDPLKLKLGKQTPRRDPRTLMFASYTTPALPAPPASLTRGKGQGPLGHDGQRSIGDCTCAAAGTSSWSGPQMPKPKYSPLRPADRRCLLRHHRLQSRHRRQRQRAGAGPSNSTCSTTAAEWHRRPQDSGFRRSRGLQPHPHHGRALDLRRLLHRTIVAKTAQAQTQNHRPWSVTSIGTTGDGAPGSWADTPSLWLPTTPAVSPSSPGGLCNP